MVWPTSRLVTELHKELGSIFCRPTRVDRQTVVMRDEYTNYFAIQASTQKLNLPSSFYCRQPNIDISLAWFFFLQIQQIETVHLLHDLEDHDEKVQLERRRQLEMLLLKREKMRTNRHVPCCSPPPFNSVKPSTDEAVTQEYLPKHVKVPTHPLRPAPSSPASVRPAHSFIVKLAER